jgi:preprotein translocase subunit YajC
MKKLFVILTLLLAISAHATENLKVGSEVTLTRGIVRSEGMITKIYNDGTASVQFRDGSNGTFDLSDLSRSTSSMFKVGQQVVYTFNGVHYDGSIIQIFRDGTAKVKFSNGSYETLLMSDLSPRRSSSKNLQLGQKVILTLGGVHYNVTILDIYSDDQASVQFQDGSRNTYPLANLSAPSNCMAPSRCAR